MEVGAGGVQLQRLFDIVAAQGHLHVGRLEVQTEHHMGLCHRAPGETELGIELDSLLEVANCPVELGWVDTLNLCLTLREQLIGRGARGVGGVSIRSGSRWRASAIRS